MDVRMHLGKMQGWDAICIWDPWDANMSPVSVTWFQHLKSNNNNLLRII